MESRNASIIFAIRAIHTLIFVFIAGCIAYIFYEGLAIGQIPTWEKDRLLFFAIGVVVIECIVFALNGWTCPLTTLAQRYGDKNERIADIFLPKVFSPLPLRILSAMFAIGILLLVIKSFLYSWGTNL